MAVILLWAKRMDLTWSVLVLTVLAVHSMAVRGNLALASPDTAAPREPAYSSTRELREATDNNTSTDKSGRNGGEESELDWLGRHWYMFIVFLVMVIVVLVLLCGCLLRRGRLNAADYPLNINQNGNRYTPHTNAPHPPLLTDSQSLQPVTHHHTPVGSSAHTDSRHTDTSFTSPPLSSAPVRAGRPLLTATSRSNPPPVSPSDSPWSFIQIVAKDRGSLRVGDTSDATREEGRRKSVGGSRQKSHHHHRHYSHHHHHGHHSPSYWQRRQRHKYLTNPLAKINGVLDDSGASLCSVPSTSGSVPSDQSSNRSDHSSCSRSENSTVVEVNVNVRLSPDQLDRSKAVAMAALAESARQLAESAANLGFSNEVQMCTRSLPHSPYPRPRQTHRHPRHSVTGAPLTTSYPPPSLDHGSPTFHCHSSSHLPPLSPSLRLAGDPRSSSPHSRMERKCSHHYSPSSLLMTSAGGRTTEDEGTVVSLDHHSSSSSCHCSSMVAHEQGQRSVLTQSPLGKAGDTVVNLDRYSSVGAHDSDADVTVVSLDRTERSTAVDYHPHLRSMNHGLHGLPATDVSNSVCHVEGGRDPPNTSPDPSSRSHKSRFQSQPTAHLNLDSQIEGTPSLKQGPRLAPHRDDRHVMNGFSYHPHVSLQAYPHLRPPSPINLSLRQQLQNISEQGESECVHSSDNFEPGDNSLVLSYDDRGKTGEVSGGLRKLAQPDLLLGVKKISRESSEKLVGTEEGIKVERKGERRQRKERHNIRSKDRDKDSWSTIEIPDRGKTDIETRPLQDMEACERENCKSKVVQTENFLSAPEDDLHSSLSENQLSETITVSPLEASGSKSSSCPSLSLDSASVEKAVSPPQSGSALSVSEALGSTASGYVATGETESTCDVEAKSINDAELSPEFDEIQQALLEARSQFSYPLQRLLDHSLLDHNSETGGPPGVNCVINDLNLPQLSSPESRSSSESVHFQSHSATSAQFSSFGNNVRSVQQIQSVDI